ncbi:MAG: hypothetical protein Q4Q06_00550, partial [Bacteroidota bacterium]|nr:hypothetical protein [Bacteroidota bacterium]
MKASYFLIGMFGFVSLFCACDNDKDEGKERTNNENLENPYNYVGQEHNIWLDSITLHVDNYEIINNIDLSEDIPLLINVCSDYMYEKGFDTIGAFQSTDNILTNVQNAYSYVVDTSSLNAQTKRELHRILN